METVAIENDLFGRHEINTSVGSVTRENIVNVVSKARSAHEVNRKQIDYLYWYMCGKQPILSRRKKVRPEICNRIVENHAAEIAQFISGYFMGEPMKYVRHGDAADELGISDQINRLNDFMTEANKAARDKDIATWMAICGVAYRMILPKQGVVDPDEVPFEIDTLDPRDVYVVYQRGFGHKRMLAVQQVQREDDEGHTHQIECGYTDTHYFEIEGSEVQKWEKHVLGDIPIYEYRMNMFRMGSFEPAVSLLNAINTIESNRVDGIETFVQSLLKFKNCDIDQAKLAALYELGAMVIKSTDGLDCDVDQISSELNQTQTQTLIDSMHERVLEICGMPTTTKGGTSTSDTGEAVRYRDGWATCAARIYDTEQLFVESENLFLKLALRILRELRGLKLKASDIDCKFTRRQHGNLQSKAQSLLSMLEAGTAPEIAFVACEIFQDPADAVARSAPYLRKWDFVPIAEEPVPDDGGDGA